MTLATDEFIRRFLIHVLPKGFHRIRYYGFLTSQRRAKNIAHVRELLASPLIPIDDIKALNAKPEEPKSPEQPCPCCGGHMRIIETFARGCEPKHRPTPPAAAIRIDTS
jgi:Putative transposase